MARSETPSLVPLPNQNVMTSEERKERLAQCLLFQYRFCAGGVVAGAAHRVLRKRTSKPVGPWVIAGGFAGALGDCAYGYFIECAHLQEEG